MRRPPPPDSRRSELLELAEVTATDDNDPELGTLLFHPGIEPGARRDHHLVTGSDARDAEVLHTASTRPLGRRADVDLPSAGDAAPLPRPGQLRFRPRWRAVGSS